MNAGGTRGLRILGRAPALALTLLAAGCLAGGGREHPRPAACDERPSHHGWFRAELRPPDGVSESPTIGMVEIWRTGGEPVIGARVSARLWSPEDDQQAESRPRVTSSVGGAYIVGPLEVGVPGWLNLALEISDGAITDSLAFNFTAEEDGRWCLVKHRRARRIFL
jgi:hypothetical protein